MRSTIAGTVCLLMASAIGTLCAAPPHADAPAAASPAAQRLRDELLRYLQQGELDRAVDTALNAARSPDPAVQAECVSLLNSIARQSLRQDDYATADKTLAAILRIAPGNADARQMTKTIADARSALPAQLREARTWLALEWYEPAFRVLGQAVALTPDRRAELMPEQLQAAIGSGDDHYFTKNFRDAFYCYDTAIQLLTADRKTVSPGLTARWLQSMVFALVDDVDRATFSPQFWQVVFQRVAATPKARTADAELRAMVRGLAAEDTGEAGQAAREYTFVAVSNGALGGEGMSLADVRRAAVNRLRAVYNQDLSDRRDGIWRKRQSGDWRVLETPGFRIHHRNEQAAHCVAAAMAFHFERVCTMLDLSRAKVPWPAPCDVWLYSDKAQYIKVMRPRKDAVLASSEIRFRGTTLESHAIHVTLSDPMLLSSTLAHELTHLIVGAAMEYRTLPGALAEGVALAAEPRCRQIQFARIFHGLPQRRTAAALLGFNETHPSDAAFYAEAANLVARLRSRRGLAPLITLPDRPNVRHVAEAFSLEDSTALEQLIAKTQTDPSEPARSENAPPRR